MVDVELPPEVDVDAWHEGLPARYAELRGELTRRLEAEPAVADFSLSSDLPVGGGWQSIAFDEAAADVLAGAGHSVRSSRVGPEFMRMFQVSVEAGRALVEGDWDEGASDVVVVNRVFVRQILGGGEALGRRLRYVGDPQGDTAAARKERWHEIVGVVADLHKNAIASELVDPRIYRPMPDVSAQPLRILLRVAGPDAAAFAPRLREIVASLDPTLRVGGGVPLSDVYRQGQLALGLVALALTLILASVLLLSAAGI